MTNKILGHGLDSDYMNEFVFLRLGLINIERGLMKFEKILEILKENPIKTYTERAKIMGFYNMKNFDESTVKKLDGLVFQTNQHIRENRLNFNILKKIVDKSYLAFYGERAFN